MQITYLNGEKVMIDTKVQASNSTFTIEFQPYTLKELLYNTLKTFIY